MNLRTAIVAAVASLAIAPTASLAVDGVILIDQNKALAGNVTAGDAPGFPVTINAPGSYRLSGNLTAPDGVAGIVFGADGVTLDLNGFSVRGGLGAIGIGDDGVARSRIRVGNGQVNGFGQSIRLLQSNHVVVEDMLVDPGPAGLAVVTGAYSRVSRNTVVGNGLIQATCPSILTENITDGFVTVFNAVAGKECIRYHNRSIGFFGAIAE